MNQEITIGKLPLQPNKEGGWTLDYSFLEEVNRIAEENGWQCGMETAERVLLAAAAILNKVQA